jgi:hypothetical protein
MTKEQTQMRPGEHASEETGGNEGSAGQPPAQVALAAVPAAPDAAADRQAAPRGGAVWDQPLPWTRPAQGEQRESTGEPTSAQSAVATVPTPRAADVREEGADATTGDTKDDAKGDTRDDADAVGDESSVALWQAAAAEQQGGAHAAPDPVGAAGVAGHAVSKWLLGVAVAVGGLLAAAGATEGLSAHHSTAAAPNRAQPIPGPGKGLDAAGTIPAGTSPSPAKSVAGKAAAAFPATGLMPPSAQSGKLVAPAQHTLEASPQRAAATPSHTSQSGYLSVQTSVTSANEYWTQSNVTVTSVKKLTALKVVVHIAQTGGVANTGVWTSLGDKVTVHAARASDGGADYVVTLNAGITLDPGTWSFQFGYNHDKGTRDTGHDLWAVVTTAAGSGGSESRQGRY